MIKGIFAAALLALSSVSAHATDITVRGLTIFVPTENPVGAELYKEGLDALFESCPQMLSYRGDIDHYGIFANIDVFAWNIDAKGFQFFHYRGKEKSGKSRQAQIADRFGWKGAVRVYITFVNKPSDGAVKKSGLRSAQFEVGGGEHPGIVMNPKYEPLCRPAHSVQIKMPDAKKEWGDPAVLVFVPNDDAADVDALF